MDKRRKQEQTRDDRKAAIAATMRATKEISELPKDAGWKTNGSHVAEVIEHVYSICERTGMIPTANLLASGLGVSRDILEDVRNGFIMANPDVVEAIGLYCQVCENTAVQSALDGNVNNIAGIFAMKALYGYKEEPREIKITHNKLLGEVKDPKAIAAKYASAVIDVKPEEVTDAEEVDW